MLPVSLDRQFFIAIRYSITLIFLTKLYYLGTVNLKRVLFSLLVFAYVSNNTIQTTEYAIPRGLTFVSDFYP
jgi:hypothetical protein